MLLSVVVGGQRLYIFCCDLRKKKEESVSPQLFKEVDPLKVVSREVSL